MNNDALRETFFAECEELIEALSEGLTAVASDDWDGETVNAIFRAVHSIKGAAGAFGFTNLVTFAHKYETVLDLIRSDKLDIDADILRLIVRSSDILAELVDGSRTEGAPVPAAAEGLMTELEDVAANAATGTSEPEEEFSFASLAALPIALDVEEATGLVIEFKPEPNFYVNGHEPLRLIKALGNLSTLELSCVTDSVPSLSSFDFEQTYLEWTMTLVDVENETAVHDVFSFVDGLCHLTITEIHAQEAEPIEDEPQSGSKQDVPPQTEKLDKVQATSATAKSTSAPKAVQATLRVDPERVDRLINSVGELIINHAEINQRITAHGIPQNSEISSALDDYRNLARDIQEGVMAIRAQPVKSLFQRMGRVVREAAEATEKKVSFITEGENTEIDKTMLERLADPLTHMLRNAVDHGLEVPTKRLETGKSEEGVVRLSAAHKSGHVVIEISDDGAGLNREAILSKAIDRGLVTPESKLSDSEIDALLFAPGFSTAENVTNLSGRGVGMDVVKTAITSLGGKVGITSMPGKGSSFSISLPLTLAVLDGMIVSVGAETMILPISNVIETVSPSSEDTHEIGPGEAVLAVRDNYVPVVDLGTLLGMRSATVSSNDGAYVLINTDGEQIAVAVDAIVDQRQVVIKSLEGNYGSIKGIAAATILGDGKVALIIDPEALLGLAARNPKLPTHTNIEAKNGHA